MDWHSTQGVPMLIYICGTPKTEVVLTRTQLSARTGDKQRIKQRIIIHTQEFKKIYIATKALMRKIYTDFDVQAYMAHSQ
jgi:hypothetical protein